MHHTPFIQTLAEAERHMGSANWPQVVDLRLPDDYAADPRAIPCSLHRDEAAFDLWSVALDLTQPVLVICQRGLKVSQAAAARLRSRGCPASTLAGGFVAWREAGLPLVDGRALAAIGWREEAPWVTRRLPKIDRAACPWLVQRFIDPLAEFLFVEPDQVSAVAARTGGIPYDVEGVAVTHAGQDCSFDTLLRIAGLGEWPPLRRLAEIVRGADNARLDLAPEAAGLLAASLGLSHLAGDEDHAMIGNAGVIYDGLYAWAAHRVSETHNWPPKA